MRVQLPKGELPRNNLGPSLCFTTFPALLPQGGKLLYCKSNSLHMHTVGLGPHQMGSTNREWGEVGTMTTPSSLKVGNPEVPVQLVT